MMLGTKDEKPANIPDAVVDDDNQIYPSGIKLVVIIGSIYVAMFLVALDKLIIATAIPAITNEFHATSDVGWYGTAYLLCSCAFLPVFGKVYKVFDVKITFLAAVFIFEIGSAICGASSNSIAFILGRAIAGLGAAAIQSGCLVVIVYAVPLASRPKYQGGVGAVFGISSILGPTLGGVFTDSSSWRWCFYMNLPFGVVVLAAILLLLKIPERPNDKDNLKNKILQLNFEGIVVLLPGVSLLCLALQWGGFTYSWSDSRIIGLLVTSICLLIIFIFIQLWRPSRAVIPPHIFAQRSIASGFMSACCLGASQTLTVYYLPIWFQAIKGDSAVHSGVQLLALTLAMVVASVFTGIVTGKLGYYTPFLIIGTCSVTLGTGLLNILKVKTPTQHVIGFQVLVGLGFGLANQAPSLAAQTVLARDDVSIGVSLMFFGMTLFGAIFVQIGQNIIDGRLIKGLQGMIRITPQEIKESGVTGLLSIVPSEQHDEVLQVYNTGLRLCFRLALIMSGLAVLGGLAMEWRSVKKQILSTKEEEKARRKPCDRDTSADGTEEHRG